MKQTVMHTWLIGSTRQEREKHYPDVQQEHVYVANCHQNRRGPYSGTGELLRQMMLKAYRKYPELVKASGIPILSMAPELKSVIEVSQETLTSLAVPKERTRYYSKMRTQRMANGLIDLLRALADLERGQQEDPSVPLTLIFEDVQACDHLDAEFISTLLRRAHPEQIKVVISSSEKVGHENLQQALQSYTEPITVADGSASSTVSESADVSATLASLSESERLELCERYIFSDGTSDCARERAAYETAPVELRQRLHDERAQALTEQDQWSLHLGAIPYHLERGSSRTQAVEALKEAVNYCMNIGFYEVVVEMSVRGRSMTDAASEFDNYKFFTMRTATSLSALGRTDGIPQLFDELLTQTDENLVHMAIAYGYSMYYTRHHRVRDHLKAREWIEKAIAHSDIIEDEKDRAFHGVFNRNGLALVELHENRLNEALQLVSEGWELLDQVLAPDEHLLHRSVLLHNRGQIYLAFKRYDEAAECFSRVIEIDPNYPEYHFDRGNLYSKMNRLEDAIADYNRAIELSPPFPEVYYNRAAAYIRQGEVDKALADLNYLLDIEPQHLDALLNRATLLYEAEQFEQARLDVERGLAIDPAHAQLLCTLGLIELALGNHQHAWLALTNALDQDKTLVAAWTNRAVLSYEMGEHDSAVDDLTEVLRLEKNGTILFNRAWVYEAQEKWQLAVEDYTDALTFEDADEPEIYYHRGICLLQLGDTAAAAEDWKKHLAYGESAYVEEMRERLPELFVQK
ncbi:tetratricopeptide repeat protein [Brevibacillus dissolubilis]|uniref:tetratricopeptide repeat protein n=1 Tax=Brevibacillus dissolubilis TaxID=1844116 RepID=UPI0011171B00|nr:tetratricopeptide repeat protein [Brevibacillus dissolubilis]